MYPEAEQMWIYDIDDYLLIFLQLAKAAEFMAKNNILHRDIKPTNILLGMNNGKLNIKLIDFGSWASNYFTESEKRLHKDVI
jgi:serine/threonine protein kinase